MLELLIALALTGLITTGITMIISQTLTGSARSSNHMAAVREVQEAGYWVSFYAYAAQDLTITGDSGFPLTLRWVDFDTDERHKVEFSLDSSGLRGSYYVDGCLCLIQWELVRFLCLSLLTLTKLKLIVKSAGAVPLACPIAVMHSRLPVGMCLTVAK